jgi:hypothetical protein
MDVKETGEKLRILPPLSPLISGQSAIVGHDKDQLLVMTREGRRRYTEATGEEGFVVPAGKQRS